jgi:phosphate transport system protein
MTRQTFDQELNRLQDELLTLGSMVEEALVQSVETLKQRDFIGSRRLIAGDRAINERRYAIEEDTAAILEIVTELERMGDYAKGIARINLMIGEQPLIKPLIDLPVMAHKAREMLHAALLAFVEHDVQAACSIPEDDDEVDALYNQVYRELIFFLLEDPHVIEQANLLMWAAHNLERTADRVINICERVVYTVTGELAELDT